MGEIKLHDRAQTSLARETKAIFFSLYFRVFFITQNFTIPHFALAVK